MADKTNNDDLNLDDKLADDLLNDIDDLDSIDGLDDMGDDIDLDSLDDIDEDDADDISKDIKASEDSIPEEDDLEVLDKEIVLNSMRLKWNLKIDEFKKLTKNLNFN